MTHLTDRPPAPLVTITFFGTATATGITISSSHHTFAPGLGLVSDGDQLRLLAELFDSLNSGMVNRAVLLPQEDA